MKKNVKPCIEMTTSTFCFVLLYANAPSFQRLLQGKRKTITDTKNSTLGCNQLPSRVAGMMSGACLYNALMGETSEIA
jgi:hypothetical protein